MPAGLVDLQARITAREESSRATRRRRTEGTRLLARAGQDLERQYAQRFYGHERAIREAGVGADAGQMVQNARDATTRAAFDVDRAFAAGDRERAAIGLGGPTASDVRRQGLARVIAQVDAGNRTSQGSVARQRAAQEYGLQQWGASASDAVSALSQIAQSETDRMNQYRQARAKYKGGILGTIGAIGGAAIGGLVGGPAGAKFGMQLGSGIGY